MMKLFEDYGDAFGQVVSKEKSTVIFGKYVQRKHEISGFLGFSVGAIPFNYLGVRIFKGRPKKIYFDRVVDKVCEKLAEWKGVCLTMAGRLQSIKLVVQGMLLHSMMIYKRPRSSLSSLTAHVWNFLWSSDVQK